MCAGNFQPKARCSAQCNSGGYVYACADGDANGNTHSNTNIYADANPDTYLAGVGG